MMDSDSFLPGLALALAIGLLLGVERGWQAREEEAGRRVAGIRTFAVLGLLGGLGGIALGHGIAILALLIFAGAVATLLLGYGFDMWRDGNVSATSTLAGILTLGLGAMATTGSMALASVGAGAAVILPLLPDEGMGPLDALNPYRLWTVVVIIGSISVVGYILVRWLGERRGAMLTAAVGALVSSTAVTIDGARRIREGAGASAHAAVALASTVMLDRSLFRVGVVAPMALAPFAALVVPGLAVSVLGTAVLLYLGRTKPEGIETGRLKPPGLGLALLFALSVAVLSVASVWAQARWGGESGAILIALGGTVDIDAAIAAVGAQPPGSLSAEVAALALAGPTLFNTLFKLGLFVAIAGWRRAGPGAAALGAAATILFVPITVAFL